MLKSLYLYKYYIIIQIIEFFSIKTNKKCNFYIIISKKHK